MLGRLIVDHLGPFWIAWVLVGERAGQWYGVAFFPSFFYSGLGLMGLSRVILFFLFGVVSVCGLLGYFFFFSFFFIW